MLEDVDSSLAALLADRLPEGVHVGFEPPRRSWARRLPVEGTLLDAWLYDVREDPEGRKADWDDIRDEKGRVVGRQPPPRRYECSYLMSVWGADPVAEHQLLGMLLGLGGDREIMTEEHRRGSLAETHLPVMLRVARPDPVRTPGLLWSALGLAPRLALDVLVSAPFVPALVTELAPPAQDLSLGVGKNPKPPGPPGPQGPQRPAESGFPAGGRDEQHWRNRSAKEPE